MTPNKAAKTLGIDESASMAEMQLARDTKLLFHTTGSEIKLINQAYEVLCLHNANKASKKATGFFRIVKKLKYFGK